MTESVTQPSLINSYDDFPSYVGEEFHFVKGFKWVLAKNRNYLPALTEYILVSPESA